MHPLAPLVVAHLIALRPILGLHTVAAILVAATAALPIEQFSPGAYRFTRGRIAVGQRLFDLFPQGPNQTATAMIEAAIDSGVGGYAQHPIDPRLDHDRNGEAQIGIRVRPVIVNGEVSAVLTELLRPCGADYYAPAHGAGVVDLRVALDEIRQAARDAVLAEVRPLAGELRAARLRSLRALPAPLPERPPRRLA